MAFQPIDVFSKTAVETLFASNWSRALRFAHIYNENEAIDIFNCKYSQLKGVDYVFCCN